MRDATSSLTRAAVLVLVTCSFAAAWNNDRQTQTAFSLAKKEHWTPSADSALTASPHSGQPHRVTPLVNRPTTIRRVTVDMTLPPDITPGRYRVIEPSGRMAGMVITVDSGLTSSRPRNRYVLDGADGGRTYFFRVPPAASGDAIQGAAAGSLRTRR